MPGSSLLRVATPRYTGRIIIYSSTAPTYVVEVNHGGKQIFTDRTSCVNYISNLIRETT